MRHRLHNNAYLKNEMKNMQRDEDINKILTLNHDRILFRIALFFASC